MSAGMNMEEAQKIANKMSFTSAVYNALNAKCVPYRKATKIKLNELLDIAKDVDKARTKVLKVKEIEPDEATLFECCKLAREYSSATQPSKVGVIYTRAKNLKKPPAAPLGYVIYKNEKEVLV